MYKYYYILIDITALDTIDLKNNRLYKLSIFVAKEIPHCASVPILRGIRINYQVGVLGIFILWPKHYNYTTTLFYIFCNQYFYFIINITNP